MKIRKCERCGRYTLKETCPVCGGKTFYPKPPKFSLEDRWGEYRRKLKRALRNKLPMQSSDTVN
ncbi:RNA-protein complex protein Nop10 [Methanocaldococcus infernus]